MLLSVSDAEALRALASVGDDMARLYLHPRTYLHTHCTQLVAVGLQQPGRSKRPGAGGNVYGQYRVCNDSLRLADIPEEPSIRGTRPRGSGGIRCAALSYGIENSDEFEHELARRSGCHVFALDPALIHRVSKSSARDHRVHLLDWAAPSNFHFAHRHCARAAGARRNCSKIIDDGKPEADAVVAGPVRVAMAVAPRPTRRVALLKMDCEGCEYRLYDEVANEADWTFFERVDQLVLETHLPRKYAANDDEFLQYGKLLALLVRAGHRLESLEAAYCGGGGQFMGLTPLVAASGYYRRHTDQPPLGNGKIRTELHCENLLFVRRAG
mgnify:CR=1 FL=1